jgi:hypothetical protein
VDEDLEAMTREQLRRARLPRRSALQGMGSLAMNVMTPNKN